ncbi:MAG: DISARM system SNF2-like helicase DrmD, partial [Candidatus Cloacimonetes bacterium]|nr:DISARM system SNF2-like helicase DrmD [Candidatus Cloacimonadota bacterium]
MSITGAAPEQGQLVRLRNRYFIVEDVIPHDTGPAVSPITRVSLECIDDDRLGESLAVIWEREVNTRILEDISLPAMQDWDKPHEFNSFLRAVRWSTTSTLSGNVLHCPFMGAIDLEPYQVAPAVRAVMMPRVNLLIADDVGLGKTIESGLVLQEMISRNRVRDCLIVCPASLQVQWQEEMDEKFNLSFKIIDRHAILNLRREYGTHVNPWQSHPWLITSMDFIKREVHLRNFTAGLRKSDGTMSSWDLMILDEAHNCAPTGRQWYVRDSQRTKMLRNLSPHFRHRLFVTATPHNGYTESFTGLLELLDPLRFHRDSQVDRSSVSAVMIRRMKDEILALGTTRNLARRRVEALEVPPEATANKIAETLDEYITSRLKEQMDANVRMPVRFALTMLKKRFLSCPLAFHRSMLTHADHFFKARTDTTETEPDRKLMEIAVKRTEEDHADDLLKDQLEGQALTECSRFFPGLSTAQKQNLQYLLQQSEKNSLAEDSKTAVLKGWIENHLKTENDWNRERLIIFTEYRDTLEYLRHHLENFCGEDRIMQLYGGMNSTEREIIKSTFQTDPRTNPLRILIATDA